MGNKPSQESKKKKKELRDYLPIMAIAGVGYLALSIIWLAGVQGMALVPSVLIGVVSLVIFTAIAAAINNAVMANTKKKGSAEQPADNPKTDGNGDADEQKKFRRQARIEALQRDTRATRDKIVRVGAVISIGLVVIALVMTAMFGLSPEEVFFVSWPVVGLIWFIQITLFPRFLTFASFFAMTAIRFGIQTFGPQILMFLPNFIMMPFFYLLMMFFMFGSIMLPSLAQVKYNRPGHGDWAVPRGATRGQPRARAMFDSAFERIEAYVDGRSDIRPPRGILASGGPGTGKTLLAKEKASWMRFPFISADGNVFNPPFMGFAPIMLMYVKGRVEALAREYGWAIVFIDECETLFGARSGMQPAAQMGIQDFNVPGNDLAMDGTPLGPTENDVMFMPGAMGGSQGIYGFLTWMDGVPSPPFFSKLVRGVANNLLSIFLPVTVASRILRLSPAKAAVSNVLFIGATNRPWMIDPAMKRPGRLDLEAAFEEMDEMGRFDVAQYYIHQLHRQGHYQDELLNADLIWAFARATQGQSPAEIEQAIREAVFVRAQHLTDLRRVMKLADEGSFEAEALASLPENERRQREMDNKFWKRHGREVRDAEGREIPDGWDERADWNALVEALSKISWGAIRHEAVHPKTQKKVAYHEVGHFLILCALHVRRFGTIPMVLTALPRGAGTLGKVVWMPNDPREMYPQEYYEAALRVSLGAWTGERFLFGQNMPGVSGDLKSATGIAAGELGRFGMPPYSCPEEQKERVIRIGSQLISQPETSSFLNPSASALVEKTLAGNRKEVALMLGMAVVDIYRLLRVNKKLYAQVVVELIKSDEISGQRLVDLQQEILAQHVGLDQMTEEDRAAFPPDDFSVVNPFYGPVVAEGADVVEMVEAILEKGGLDEQGK